MHLSELTKIEAGIGFTIGILIGAVAAMISILFFMQWQWYFKLFSAIGSLGIIGSLILGLMQQITMRRNLIEAMKDMDNIHKESLEVVNNTITTLKGGKNE